MQKLSQEDIVFLKALQHEMLTQDKVCQAAPRFWVVKGTTEQYGQAEGYADYMVLRADEDTILKNMKEACDYLTENYSECFAKIEYNENDDTIIYCKIDGIESEDEDEDAEDYDETLGELQDVVDFLEGLDKADAELVGYSEVETIYKNTLFLTLQECRDHIKSNYYHYSEDAHPYAMTAWRAPQVERLFEIIEETNWEALSDKDIEVESLFEDLSKFCDRPYNENDIAIYIESKGYDNVDIYTNQRDSDYKIIRFNKIGSNLKHTFELCLERENSKDVLLGGIAYKNTMYGIW